MIARKGVLLSDPSVREMTYLQWLVEASALRKKEKDEQEDRSAFTTEVFKAAAKTFRETLVHLLGLNIGAGKNPEGDMTPFRPLISTLARADVVEELLKMEKEDEGAFVALEDESADALNEDLMDRDFGDLEPLLTGPLSNDPRERWLSPENLEMMRAMGVEIKDGVEEELG